MMNTFFMTTAYGFVLLPISVIILGILLLLCLIPFCRGLT